MIADELRWERHLADERWGCHFASGCRGTERVEVPKDYAFATRTIASLRRNLKVSDLRPR